jgi:hypothetical protein
MDTRHVVDFGVDPPAGALWVELDAEPGLGWTYALAHRVRGDAFVVRGRHLCVPNSGRDEPDALTKVTALVAAVNDDVEQMSRFGS